MAFEPALPMFSELMEGVARTLRDVEASRYAMLSLMPEPDRMLAVRLIQRRYRISARRARQKAIDDFTDITGVVVGMDSMVMPFPVARDTSLDGLSVGDSIEAILEIDWEQGRFQLEHIKKLPRGTALHFGKARGAARGPSRSDDTNQEKRP